MMRFEIQVHGKWWGCNKYGEGLFIRDPQGGWQQLRGTGQTPAFTTEQQLRRYIYRHYRKSN